MRGWLEAGVGRGRLARKGGREGRHRSWAMGFGEANQAGKRLCMCGNYVLLEYKDLHSTALHVGLPYPVQLKWTWACVTLTTRS